MADLTADTAQAVDLLLQFAEQEGLRATIRSTVRTCAEQNALYAKGRTQPGAVVTNARGCISWHVLRRAVDISLPTGSPVSDYERLGLYWESLGGFWGGRIAGLGDFGHFEWHPGVTIEQLCSNPSDCDAAVQKSMALHLAPPGARDWLVPLGVALCVFCAWWIYDHKR